MQLSRLLASFLFVLPLFAQITTTTDASQTAAPHPSTTNAPTSTTFVTSTSIYAATSTQSYSGTSPVPTGGSAIDTNAGASGGTSGSYGLSEDGMIAIIVVVVVVVILGVVSTVLYIIAKRRQWDIRGSIARAAERIATPLTPRFPRTPRTPGPDASSSGRVKRAKNDYGAGGGTGGNRRVTVHAGRLAGARGRGEEDGTPLDPYGQKGGLGVEERDVEKDETPIRGEGGKKNWVSRLMGNGRG